VPEVIQSVPISTTFSMQPGALWGAHILDQHLPNSYRTLGSNNKPKKSGSKQTTSAADEPVDCFSGQRYALRPSVDVQSLIAVQQLCGQGPDSSPHACPRLQLCGPQDPEIGSVCCARTSQD
jgi:hypothetical protein